MIRALVVDDEALSRRAVRQLCARHPDVTVVAECQNGAEALAALREFPIDVAFLDVRMPGLHGLDVARCLREMRPLVVFISAYEEFALPAFDVAATDYLTKPLNRERFAVALERVRARLADVGQAPAACPQPRRSVAHLVCRVRDRDVLVPVESVEYIAADDVYAEVHSSSGVHLLRQSLDLLAASLDPASFVRVHRSYIVHALYVDAARRTTAGHRMLLLRSGAKVPVSRRRWPAVKDVLARGFSRTRRSP